MTTRTLAALAALVILASGASAALAQTASLVRGGCTLAPDAYLFSVIDRAVAVESRRLPKR